MISGTSGIAGGADSNFVLQKDRRTENTATLICTGRDIEGRELFLEFNRCTFVWELLSPIAIDVLIIPDELFLLSDFIKSQGSFTGTTTELAEVLRLELRPAVLKKRLIKHMAYLNKNGISYSENRTFERREFSLVYNLEEDMVAAQAQNSCHDENSGEIRCRAFPTDSNDDMTIESCPSNLPSLPSALSAEEETVDAVVDSIDSESEVA